MMINHNYENKITNSKCNGKWLAGFSFVQSAVSIEFTKYTYLFHFVWLIVLFSDLIIWIFVVFIIFLNLFFKQNYVFFSFVCSDCTQKLTCTTPGWNVQLVNKLDDWFITKNSTNLVILLFWIWTEQNHQSESWTELIRQFTSSLHQLIWLTLELKSALIFKW